jgi:hypothetical protein
MLQPSICGRYTMLVATTNSREYTEEVQRAQWCPKIGIWQYSWRSL